MNPPPPPPPPAHASPYAPAPQHDYSNAAAATAQAALSQQHVSTPGGPAAATANGRKRKASGVPGSRGVANLTPEQLAKKRANDREAQRAIRERTRNTIESLERRIKELESQQPYQDLQRVIQERDRALAECESLRRKLATVANLAGGEQQQQQQQPNLHELAALTAQQSPLPPLQQHVQGQHSPGAAQPQFEQQMLHPDLRSPHGSSQAGASSHAGTPVTSHPQDASPGMKWEAEPHAQYAPSNGAAYDAARQQTAGQANGERIGVNFLLDQTQKSGTPPPGNRRQHHYSSPRPTTEPSAGWASRLPRNTPYTCPLDSLLGEFVANCRQQLDKGVPLPEVVGPEEPSFAGLVSPDPQHRDYHPISALLIDILSKFPDISATPEKVAVLYVMFLTLRWQICRTESSYARLPEWMRPTTEQLDIPHPAWNDHLPWPVMRRRLLKGSAVDFEEFFIPFTSTLSLNWSYANGNVLLEEAGDPESVKVNPAFETHLRDLRNWTLGTRFRDTFPRLVDQDVKIRDVKK